MDETHEYDVRMPPSWSIEMNSDPATVPANDTTPSAGARIGVPNGAAMSIPRCPAPYGVLGASYGRMTSPRTGHRYVPNAGPPDVARAARPTKPPAVRDEPSSIRAHATPVVATSATTAAAAVIRNTVFMSGASHSRHPEISAANRIEPRDPCQ